MAHAFAKAHPDSQPEYSVYIYHYPENQHEGQNDWEMRTSTPDLNLALHKAQSLYASQSYRKVEVKQRFLDPKTEKMRDATLKVFAHETHPASMSAWVLAS
ncbi:MAG: hypothetical protein AAF204_04760, partial [Pseudomonadota bacterium]